MVAALAAVVLFLHGLQGFGRELQSLGGDNLRRALARLTSRRWQGFLVGAVTTAVLQSSSATTSLTVGLVDSSMIALSSGLAIVVGANVGTTATAWLVSFKLTGIGAFALVLGAASGLLPGRARLLSKPLFYFGLIFFALDLLNSYLAPMGNHGVLRDWLALAASPLAGVAMGLVFTALVQSSSVATGVAIVLVHQGVLPAEAAIPIVIGTNVGSTSTALIASIGTSPTARATALANLLFNLGGLALFLPLLGVFPRWIVGLAGNPAMAVALAHTIFNVATAATALLFLPALEARLRRMIVAPSA